MYIFFWIYLDLSLSSLAEFKEQKINTSITYFEVVF